MEVVAVEIKVPKESKEVVDLIAEIVKLAKAKAEVAAYLALIPLLAQAVEGYDKLGDELKSEYKGDLVGYLTKSITALI